MSRNPGTHHSMMSRSEKQYQTMWYINVLKFVNGTVDTTHSTPLSGVDIALMQALIRPRAGVDCSTLINAYQRHFNGVE
jgi:hypothetical protein